MLTVHLQLVQTAYTMGAEIVSLEYHADVVRSSLTRNIGAKFPEVRDEIITAFSDEIPTKDGV